jgi:5-formyltetrahydrofolate cyclo-ligase
MSDNETIAIRKDRLRQKYTRCRAAQANKATASRRICERVTKLPEYSGGELVSMYVSMPTEVQTLEFINEARDGGKDIAVPCCLGNDLQLFHLQTWEDLAPRTLGILEPLDDLRQRHERWLDVSRIDVFLLPGVAFDRWGGRLGHGKGYYDRLLAKARPEASRIALAFECQMVDQVPMTVTDAFVDFVVTENGIYRCHRGAGHAG